MIVRGKKVEPVKIDISLNEIIKALKNEALGRHKGGRVDELYIKDDRVVCNVSTYENKAGIAIITADEEAVRKFKAVLELEKIFKNK